jgi:hypothetical protein
MYLNEDILFEYLRYIIGNNDNKHKIICCFNTKLYSKILVTNLVLSFFFADNTNQLSHNLNICKMCSFTLAHRNNNFIKENNTVFV